MLLIKYFTACIWAIVGLVFWIPISIRIMSSYISGVMIITIREKSLDANIYAELLTGTGAIYINGFKNIFSTEYKGEIKKAKSKISEKEFWINIGWSFVFWGVLIIQVIL